MSERIKPDVLVIIGSGGMSTAISRRLSSGRHTCLVENVQDSGAVSSPKSRAINANSLSHHETDLTSYESVKELANEVSSLGRIEAIITAPGFSPLSSTPKQIYEVELLGVAHVIEAFLPFLSPTTSFICIASTAANIASYLTPLSRGLEKHLASAPTNQLLNHPELGIDAEGSEACRRAFAIAKRGNQLRVEGAAVAYGGMGARINSVSPGMILMKMVKDQMEKGPSDAGCQELIGRSVMGKVGTVEDVANVVAFLVGHESHYITGIDIVVDGGTLARSKWAN